MNKQARDNFDYLLALHNNLLAYFVTKTKMFDYSKARIVLKRYGANGSVLQIDIPHAILDVFEMQEDLGTIFELSLHVNKDNMLKMYCHQGYGYRPKKVAELDVDMSVVDESTLCQKIISMIDFLITADEDSDYFEMSPACDLADLQEVLEVILDDISYDFEQMAKKS